MAQWFLTLESRITWTILRVINRLIVIPYRKLFPSPVDKCQWCGHAKKQDLTVISGDDYSQSPISVCTKVADCTERYWAKDF